MNAKSVTLDNTIGHNRTDNKQAKVLPIVLAGFGLSAILVLAGCAGGARMRARFAEHDLDGDGGLSVSEFRQTRIAGRSEAPDTLFHEIDSNADQLLSFEEIMQYVRGRQARSTKSGG